MKTIELVGREEELRVLREVLAAGADAGAVILVTGEPGIGKTGLLSAVREAAREQGALMLAAVGVEAEAQLPFAALYQLLSPIIDDTANLTDPQREALLTAFGLHNGTQPSLFLIGEAVLALLTHASQERQVVLIADDVQWLDSQTHEILTFLAHRASSCRLTLIGASRAHHPGPLVEAGFPRLEVTGLDDADAQVLLDKAAHRLTAGDRQRIQSEALGNPLALLELPTVWHTTPAGDRPNLSARLERAFAGRISGLPPATRDALLVASVDSSNDIAEIVAGTAALRGTSQTTSILQRAIEVGLVSVDGDSLEFRHPLVRSGVLQYESVTRRQAAHRALADTLDDSRVGHPFRRTWHRAQSIVGPDDEIADELEANVTDSLRRGAVMAAVSSLERAAELSGSSAVRGHRLLVAAEHAFGMGRSDVVHRLVDDAARTDLNDLDWARMQWLREIFEDGSPGDAVRVLELCEVARRSATAGDIDLALNLLLGAALRCWWADTGAAARAEVAASVTGLPAGDEDPRWVAALAVAEPVLLATEVSHRFASTDLASVTNSDALRLYGMAAHAIGDSVLATDLLDRAEGLLREQARLGLLPHVLGMQVNIRHELGDWDGASSAMREVERLTIETGQPIWSLNNLILDAQSNALRGDWQQALELLAGAEIEATRRQLNDTLSLVRMTRGTALIAAGRFEAAYDCLRRQFDPADSAYHQRESFASLGFLAEAAVSSGGVADARKILEEMERLALVTPSTLLQVHLFYARAVLAPDSEADTLFRQAVAVDLHRWPWPRARLRAAYGGWLLRHDRPGEADEHLRAALSTFEEIGATTWARDVRRQLDPLGLR